MGAALKTPRSDRPATIPPPAARGVDWIALDVAAQRSGLGVRQLRRLCGAEWFARGLARCERPPGGGRAAWFVREDADPRLARVAAPERIAFDVRQLPEARRRELMQRRAIVDGWARAKSAGVAAGRAERDVTADFLRGVELEHGLKVSRSTLYGWHNAYRVDGLAGLVDRRWQPPTEKRTADDPFYAELQRRYLDLRRPTLTVCHRDTVLIAQRRGWQLRSYHASKRFIRSIPEPVLMKFRGGDKLYTDGGECYIERDYTTLASNDVWVGDHHQFDVIVDVGGGRLARPWLTAWEDMRSRKIVGWHVGAGDPNQDTILAAFRDAIHPQRGDCGVPLRVYIDNGKDYDSYALHGRTKRDRFRARRFKLGVDESFVQGLFGELGVETTHCQPYHGQSKPIERFFGTLEDRFGRGWPTYCGNSPANKPFNLQEQLDRGKAPALREFVDAFGCWLRDDYHHRAHGGQGMEGRTPEQAYRECLASKRTAPAELLDVLLQQKSKPVRVQQNGVRWHGLTYGQHERQLFELIGREVYLRTDPRDLSHVTVWTLDNRFVCRAACNVRLPAMATREDLRAAIGTKRRRDRVVGEYHRHRMRLHEDTADLLARETADRLRREREAETPPPPATAVPVQTPIDDQMPALREAMDRQSLRIAAGAENSPPPFDMMTFFRQISEQDEAERAEREAAERRDPFGDLLAHYASERAEDDR